MNINLQNKISEIKKKYFETGFIILGIFGSYARGEETEKSDIDILYSIDATFPYKGLKKIYQLELIKNELKEYLGKEVDIVNRDALGDIGKKYILKDVVYVK